MRKKRTCICIDIFTNYSVALVELLDSVARFIFFAIITVVDRDLLSMCRKLMTGGRTLLLIYHHQYSNCFPAY